MILNRIVASLAAAARIASLALLAGSPLWLAACGGSSTQDTVVEILPDGPNDPRAYTEQFLSRNPGAVLRPGLIAILSLEPTSAAEDTDTQDGVDAVRYLFDLAAEVDLVLEPDAEHVGALVLRDQRGREVARATAGTTRVSVAAGHHTLEVHHGDAGNAAAPTQTVFVRLGTPPGATLQASANCVGCNFDRASLLSQTFDGLDLSSSTFVSADVESCSFAGANLDGTSWTTATLRNDVFAGASMQHADLSSDVAVPTSIFSCDFRGADLSGAYFDQADIYGATFGDTDPNLAANLSNTSWRTLVDPCFITQVEVADFRNVDLSGARFLGTQISGSDFSGALLTGVDFTGGPGECSQLTPPQPVVTVCDAECTFGTEPTSGRNTDFSQAILASTTAPSIQLQGKKLSGVILQGTQFTAGEFDGYDLSGSDLTGASLVGAQLNGANLEGATLTGVLFDSVQLNDAALDSLDLRGQNLTGVQLNGASLYEANLQGATLDNAQMVGARLNLSNLKDASLRGVLAGVQPGTSTEVTELAGAYMVNVDLTDADLRGADLSDAHLYGTSQLVRTLLDSADLTGAICAGTAFSGSFNDTVFNQAVLVNATFNGADLTDAKFDTAYLQGTDFSAASSVLSATLRNAQVSTASGSWTFTEQDGTPYTFEYGATALGPFATDGSVICPNEADGPCTPGTLTPVDHGPFPPQPKCVPTYQFCFENCLDPPVYDVHPPNCG